MAIMPSSIQCPTCKTTRHHKEFKTKGGPCNNCRGGMGMYAVMPNYYYNSMTGSGPVGPGTASPTQSTPSTNAQNINLNPQS